jgi:4-amino-4-deoxy-L-arabinose transferase-like glycosyltransferase
VERILKFKLGILLILIISALYFALRLPNLTLQPIFADEAIYIRWAQVMKSEPTLRFLPLSDGKTPLFMWAMMPMFKIFHDPLLAGRILSVFAGFFTLLGAIVLGWKFFKPSVGLWAGLLIAITPYIVFFDRMALVDSMLAAFSLWILIFALFLIKYPRIDLAMVLGYLLGAGIITKTPGMFNFLALPITLISFSWLGKDSSKRLIRLLLLWMLAIFIGMVIYNMLRLGPGFTSLSSRNEDYIFSPLRIFEYPLDPFIPHIRDLADWFPKMFTLPILLASFGGILLAFFKRNLLALTIFAWAMFPLIIEMFLLKTFTTRYVLTSIAPLLFLAGYFLNWLVEFAVGWLKRQREVKGIKDFASVAVVPLIALIILPLPLHFNYLLLTKPEDAPLPRESRRGYFEDWTAGVGLKEIAEFLIDKTKNGNVVVGTGGYFGTLPDGLYIYLDKTPNIAVIGGKATISAQLKDAALKHQTYFVANDRDFNYVDTHELKLIKQYPKVKGPELPQDAMNLYQVFPAK